MRVCPIDPNWFSSLAGEALIQPTSEKIMTILQEYSDTTKELVATAVDTYKEALDTAINGTTVNIDALLEAVETLRAELIPLIGEDGAERVLDKIYDDAERASLEADAMPIVFDF